MSKKNIFNKIINEVDKPFCSKCGVAIENDDTFCKD